MKRLALALLLTSTLPSYAQEPCYPTEKVVSELAKIGEHLTVTLVPREKEGGRPEVPFVLDIYMNTDTGTWTMVQRYPQTSCLFVQGEGIVFPVPDVEKENTQDGHTKPTI